MKKQANQGAFRKLKAQAEETQAKINADIIEAQNVSTEFYKTARFRQLTLINASQPAMYENKGLRRKFWVYGITRGSCNRHIVIMREVGCSDMIVVTSDDFLAVECFGGEERYKYSLVVD